MPAFFNKPDIRLYLWFSARKNSSGRWKSNTFSSLRYNHDLPFFDHEFIFNRLDQGAWLGAVLVYGVNAAGLVAILVHEKQNAVVIGPNEAIYVPVGHACNRRHGAAFKVKYNDVQPCADGRQGSDGFAIG